MSKSKQFEKGPRLLFNCRGSYLCNNSECPNIQDFGINRTDFEKTSNDETICRICGNTASFFECEARLILEQDSQNKTVKCKHHGEHTCPKTVTGRKENLKEMTDQFPRLSREGLIRQEVQKKLEKGTFSDAVKEAKQFRHYVC